MFTDNNLKKFMRGDLLKFMERQTFKQFRTGIELSDTATADDMKPEEVPANGTFSITGGRGQSPNGGGGFGGGGGASFGGAFVGDTRVKDQDAEQLVEVTYGHFGEEKKRYTYKARGAAVGKPVSATVTHWKSGKNYKTLAVIRNVIKKEENIDERQNELAQASITLKTIDASDMNQYVTTGKTAKGRAIRKLVYSPKSKLPGWKKFEMTKKGILRTHAQASSAWRRDSRKRHMPS